MVREFCQSVVQGRGVIHCKFNDEANKSQLSVPVLSAIPSVEGHTIGKTLSVDISGFQTATNTGTLAWRLVNAPTGVTIDTSTGIVTVAMGTSVFSIDGSIGVAVDGPGGSSTVRPLQFSVTSYDTEVGGTPVPVNVEVTSSPAMVSLLSNLSASIPVGLTAPLSWSIFGAPTGVTVDPVTGTLTVAVGTSATAITTVWVVDGSGSLVGIPVALNSLVYNTPVLNEIPFITADTATTAYTLDLSAFQTASNTGNLSWSLTNAPTGVTIDAASGVLTFAVGVSVSSVSGAVIVSVVGATGVIASRPLTFSIETFGPFVTARYLRIQRISGSTYVNLSELWASYRGVRYTPVSGGSRPSLYGTWSMLSDDNFSTAVITNQATDAMIWLDFGSDVPIDKVYIRNRGTMDNLANLTEDRDRLLGTTITLEQSNQNVVVWNYTPTVVFQEALFNTRPSYASPVELGVRRDFARVRYLRLRRFLPGDNEYINVMELWAYYGSVKYTPVTGSITPMFDMIYNWTNLIDNNASTFAHTDRSTTGEIMLDYGAGGVICNRITLLNRTESPLLQQRIVGVKLTAETAAGMVLFSYTFTSAVASIDVTVPLTLEDMPPQ